MQNDHEYLLSSYVSNNVEDTSIGSIDELGFYALIEVGDAKEQKSIADMEDELDWLEPGWYVYREDNQGFQYWERHSTLKEALEVWESVESMYEDFYNGSEEQ